MNQPRKLSKTKSLSKQGKTSGLSSYEDWISKQVQDRVRNKTGEKFKTVGSTVPKDTFASWLEKQPVVEVKIPENSSVPASAFDEWMKKQVAAKQSDAESGPAGSETEPQVSVV